MRRVWWILLTWLVACLVAEEAVRGACAVQERQVLQEKPLEGPVMRGPEREANQSVEGTSRVEEALRFNYAAEQCGAKILESSAFCKGADNILSGSFDTYMLGICGRDNWVVLELCEEIAVESLTVANMEHFSSNLQQFTVSGSKR
jgi:hypothetical protein